MRDRRIKLLNDAQFIPGGLAQGLTEAMLESELPGIELADKVNSINVLLVKRRLQIFKNGDSLVYKEARRLLIATAACTSFRHSDTSPD